MDDYAALVERVCFTLPKVRGCLLLSEDGLVLSAYPDDNDSAAETAWLRFCTLGEPVRGFLAFADQVWVYVRHGAYASFVVAEAGVRPGVLVDQLEQVLTTANVTLPTGTFHVPEATSPAPDPPKPEPSAAAAPRPEPKIEDRPARPPEKEPAPAEVAAASVEQVSASAQPAASADAEGSWRHVRAADRPEEEDGEIDRVQLAQEFSGLLQMDRADDEASS